MDMPPEVLDKALRLAAHGDASLTVQLTGGEPALVPELVERAVAAAETIPRPLTIALQTSGVGLTRPLADFCRAHRVQAGVSLDGPPPVQEAIRGQAAAALRGLALLEEAGILEYEQVQIVDIDNGNRFETYTIAGEPHSGIICLNGAAAKCVSVGDKVIIMAYANMTPQEAASHRPSVLFVDAQNHIVRKSNYEKHGRLEDQ